MSTIQLQPTFKAVADIPVGQVFSGALSAGIPGKGIYLRCARHIVQLSEPFLCVHLDQAILTYEYKPLICKITYQLED